MSRNFMFLNIYGGEEKLFIRFVDGMFNRLKTYLGMKSLGLP